MIAGVVIAGGKGTRLGNPHKALLIGADGRTLLDRLLAELAAAGASPLVISANDPAGFARPGVTVVPDRREDAGPLAGLEAALLAAADGVTALLVVPGDLPAFSRREASALIAAWRASSRPQVAVTASGMQALCAVVPVTALPVVQRYLDRGQRSAHGLWQELGAGMVVCADEPAFANLNTPEDVRRWRP